MKKLTIFEHLKKLAEYVRNYTNSLVLKVTQNVTGALEEVNKRVLPPGGKERQLLVKSSNDDYDVEYVETMDPILLGGVPYGKELTESWSELQARIKAGNFDGIHVGDYKIITLTTGEMVVMEVAGIDTYYNCGDQAIGHHIDFISRDCLKGAKVFNISDKNNGTQVEPNPWRASDLFRAMNDETAGVYANLPDDLKPYIIDKRSLVEIRYSDGGDLSNSSGWVWNFMGKLWLPTEREVWGSAVWGDQSLTGSGGCNIQYPIFIGGAKHIIKGDGNGGSRVVWWEATSRRDSSTHMCSVAAGGAAASSAASSTASRVPLCFRIG